MAYLFEQVVSYLDLETKSQICILHQNFASFAYCGYMTLDTELLEKLAFLLLSSIWPHLTCYH